MTSGVELRGDTALADGMRQVGARLEDWPAVRQVAEDWRDRGQRRAPKVSGRLATSLEARAADGGWEVASSLPYARVIHNGWAAHSIRANPFLADTLDPEGALVLLADDLADQLDHVRGA